MLTYMKKIMCFLDITYYKNFQYHRTDGPAHVIYRNNIIYRESYYIDGLLHRIDGPAKIDYDKWGHIEGQTHYIRGKRQLV